MRKKTLLRIISPEVFFLSVGGIGFIKKAPGTFGTLAAMPLLIFIHYYQVPIFFFIPVFIGVFAISIYTINFVQKKYLIQDPSWIVIDEVLGVLALAPFIIESSPVHYTVAFCLFRFFDIVKIWPINWIDQNIKNGFGVILDDIVAGIMSIITYRLIFFLLTVIQS